MRTSTLLAAAGLAAGATVLRAQSFTNGDFENGTLSGWTVTNTPNGAGAPGEVVTIDIDGPGPRVPSPAAHFTVGQVLPAFPNQEGIEMIQGLSLTAGVEYTFDFDWSAQRLATFDNAEGGVFSLIVEGTAIATQAAGTVNAATPVFGHLHTTFTPATTGEFRVGLRITRPYLGGPGTGAADVSQYVDNITIAGGGAACYPDCNGDHALNVNDFICFQGAFAANNVPLADCNHDNTLNVNDFICFQSAFAAGCSAP